MNIKEDMFIRTIDGEIRKVDKYIEKYARDFLSVRNEIKKSSYNIIDLIEAGDLVNGHIVSYSKEYGLTICGGNILLYDVDIKTILTHEQIEQNEYKVEE